jgi:hypothetical protein
MTASGARQKFWYNMEGCTLCIVQQVLRPRVTEIWGNVVWRKVVHPSNLWRKVATASFMTEKWRTGEWRKVLHRVRCFRLIENEAPFLLLKRKNLTCFHFASDFVFPFNYASNFSIGFNEIKITKKRKPYILGYSLMLLLACSAVLDISSIPPLLASLLLLASFLWWCPCCF